jgi:hypothetical protein
MTQDVDDEFNKYDNEGHKVITISHMIMEQVR